MNIYQREQLDALCQVRNALKQMPDHKKKRLVEQFKPYLDFRSQVDRYLQEHLSAYCTQACFNSQTSACCSKDGIIIFWADVVINACNSTPDILNKMALAIKGPLSENKCIFLGSNGCLWKIRPLVCAMFFCDQAQLDIINKDPDLNSRWENFRTQAKAFRYPDSPVLFDRLEELFLDFGCQSPLMYINSSPGLMRVKKKAGLVKPIPRVY